MTTIYVLYLGPTVPGFLILVDTSGNLQLESINVDSVNALVGNPWNNENNAKPYKLVKLTQIDLRGKDPNSFLKDITKYIAY